MNWKLWGLYELARMSDEKADEAVRSMRLGQSRTLTEEELDFLAGFVYEMVWQERKQVNRHA